MYGFCEIRSGVGIATAKYDIVASGCINGFRLCDLTKYLLLLHLPYSWNFDLILEIKT